MTGSDVSYLEKAPPLETYKNSWGDRGRNIKVFREVRVEGG